MQDLAMYILEILMNSIHANSKLIKLLISFITNDDEVKIIVEDDGKGMDEERLKNVSSPFSTSRTTRKIGLGVAFLKSLCESCEGDLVIESKVGVGTKTTATYKLSHIDSPPLGNIGEMMMFAIQANEKIDYEFDFIKDDYHFNFNTKDIREQLGGINLDNPDVLLWIKDYINQEIRREDL